MGIGVTIGPHFGPNNKILIGGGRSYFGSSNPNSAVLLTLQSNSGGAFCVATNMSGYPGIEVAYSNVKITRRGSLLGDPPTWISEGPEDLQPRLSAIGANFPIGGNGIELSLGRALDALSGMTAKWKIIIHFIDGSGLEDNWINSAYPTAGPPAQSQLITEIQNQLTAMNAHLELVIPIGGEHDANGSPDAADWFANMNTFFLGTLRSQFGPFKIVIPSLNCHSAAASQLNMGQIVDGNWRVRSSDTLNLTSVVNTNQRAFRVDNLHYAEVNGYGEIGDDVSAAYSDLRNGVTPANPYLVGVGAPVVGNSAQGVSPIPPLHQANDILLLFHSGNGDTAYGVPAGWAAAGSAPQHLAGATNARASVFWIRASGNNSVTTPTVADNAGDGGKCAVILAYRGCRMSGNPWVTSAGATAVTSTSVSCPTVDTTGTNNCAQINFVAATLTTNGAKYSAWAAGTGVTKLLQQVDFFASGTAAGLGIFDSVIATGQAAGATTATLSATADQALVTLALTPT